jgi:hypothetical protein
MAVVKWQRTRILDLLKCWGMEPEVAPGPRSRVAVRRSTVTGREKSQILFKRHSACTPAEGERRHRRIGQSDDY